MPRSKKTESRGGAREGAGRPPGDKGGYLVFYAAYKLFHEFMAKAEKLKTDAPTLLRQIVTDWLDANREDD